MHDAGGAILRPLDDWVLVPPGDAALTRRIKAAGPTWTVQEQRGRRIFSRGVWAPQAVVEVIRQVLGGERSTVASAKRREVDTQRQQRQTE